MDAVSVCRRLYDAGVTLALDGDKLMAAPASRLTDEMRQLIRDHKPLLVVMLKEAHSTVDALVTAAMRACDHHGDGEAARQQMRQECLATPTHWQSDLLAHFRETF